MAVMSDDKMTEMDHSAESGGLQHETEKTPDRVGEMPAYTVNRAPLSFPLWMYSWTAMREPWYSRMYWFCAIKANIGKRIYSARRIWLWRFSLRLPG